MLLHEILDDGIMSLLTSKMERCHAIKFNFLLRQAPIHCLSIRSELPAGRMVQIDCEARAKTKKS